THTRQDLHDLGRVIERRGRRVHDDIERRDTDDPRTYVSDFQRAVRLGCRRIDPLDSPEAVPVVDVIEDELLDFLFELRLRDRPCHVITDGIRLLTSLVVLLCAFPLQPPPLREHRGEIIRVKVIANLSKLRDGSLVAPRERTIRSRSRIGRVDILTEFALLSDPVLTEHIPFLPVLCDTT